MGGNHLLGRKVEFLSRRFFQREKNMNVTLYFGCFDRFWRRYDFIGFAFGYATEVNTIFLLMDRL